MAKKQTKRVVKPVKAKAQQAKAKQATDATMRNVRASARRNAKTMGALANLALSLADLQSRVTALERTATPAPANDPLAQH